MGLIRMIKDLLVKKKKKKKSIQDQLKDVAVASIFVVPLALLVTSFTPYGADASQYLINRKPHASWAPWLQLRTANIYKLWTQYRLAATSFKLYYTNYAELIGREKIMEIEYLEMSAYQDGEQYLSAQNMSKEFLERYTGYEGMEIFQKVKGMNDALNAMESSKRIDNPINWY